MIETPPSCAGAPPCGLYLCWTARRPLDDIARTLQSVFRVMNASDYARNMHIVEWAPAKSTPEDRQALAALCAHNGIVFVVRNDIGAAKSCGADGVILDDPAQFPAAREAFGPEGIVGLRCGVSRERAEAALTVGADCVVFHARKGALPSPGLASWWSTQTAVPCIISGSLTNDDAGAYVRHGAGFLDASDYVFKHPQGVLQGTVDMLYAIDLACAQDKLQ